MLQDSATGEGGPNSAIAEFKIAILLAIRHPRLPLFPVFYIDISGDAWRRCDF